MIQLAQIRGEKPEDWVKNNIFNPVFKAFNYFTNAPLFPDLHGQNIYVALNKDGVIENIYIHDLGDSRPNIQSHIAQEYKHYRHIFHAFMGPFLLEIVLTYFSHSFTDSEKAYQKIINSMQESMNEHLAPNIIKDLIHGPGFINSFWGYKNTKPSDSQTQKMVNLLRIYHQTIT